MFNLPLRTRKQLQKWKKIYKHCMQNVQCCTEIKAINSVVN